MRHVVAAPFFFRIQRLEFFSFFADGDQSNVVILRRGAGKISHILDDAVNDRLSAFAGTGTDRFDCALDTELVTCRVKRLGHAIGVEKQTITALNRDVKIVSHSVEYAAA